MVGGTSVKEELCQCTGVEVETPEKVSLLNGMKLGQLTDDIKNLEIYLEKLLIEDAAYRSKNVRYLASYGEDCAEVKGFMASLIQEPPDVNTAGKKMTAPMIEAWLRQQRVANQKLAEAIKLQNEVTFKVENNRIYIDMSKKRLESLKGVLALRTAEIEFLK
jgi:hypothetical protein